MSDTSRLQTSEIADADLDSVAGGLSVTGTVDSVTAAAAQISGGAVVIDSLTAASVTVSDIPLDGPSVTV
jgi:hypothetical protein